MYIGYLFCDQLHVHKVTFVESLAQLLQFFL